MPLYVLFKKSEPVLVTTISPFTGTPSLKEFPNVQYDTVKDGWDFKSYEEVTGLALKLTAMTGKSYLGADAGPNISPRFSVFEPPAVGDDVSYGFNGDSYPCGKITKISKGWRIETSEGKTFNRKKNTGGWKMVGGTWSLISGTQNTTNPSF